MTTEEEYDLHVLIPRGELATIVKELADRISSDYRGGDLVLVCVLKGAFIFLSDLVRLLQIPVEIDFVRLASYGSKMKSSGTIELTKDIEISIKGKDVLVIEDIVDSGRTLHFLRDRLSASGARTVRICTLLDKKARREVEINADYVGKEIDDLFVVGYGIDFREAYRYLPDLCYVTPAEHSKE